MTRAKKLDRNGQVEGEVVGEVVGSVETTDTIPKRYWETVKYVVGCPCDNGNFILITDQDHNVNSNLVRCSACDKWYRVLWKDGEASPYSTPHSMYND